MHGSILRAAWVLGGSFVAFGLAGCSGKSKSGGEGGGDVAPPPALAANTPAPTEVVPPKVTPPAKKPETGPLYKPSSGLPTTFPKGGATPLPKVPMPELPNKKPAEAPAPTPKPPPEPEPDPKEAEPEKKLDPNKPFEWPESWQGRPMSEYIRDISDPDPAIREAALRTLPRFGPNAQAPATKLVLFHMDGSHEHDTGVRAAAFEAVAAFASYNKEGGLEKSSDTDEAIRLLQLAAGKSGSAVRLHAIQTLASFGSKAEKAVHFLVGQNMTVLEPAYQTRIAIASTLGAIGYNKDKGPSHDALNCLVNVLIKDKSAAVRLAAYQSIVILGPPMIYVPSKGLEKSKLVPDVKVRAAMIKAIRRRLEPFRPQVGAKIKKSATGLVETNEQGEIFARFAIMRFDQAEVTDKNLDGIAKYLKNDNTGVQKQALSALRMMGPLASRKINEVCAKLKDENPDVAIMAVYTLVAMGTEGMPAIDFLEELKQRGTKPPKKGEEPKKGEKKKEPTDYPNELYIKLATEAIKLIKEAKPPMPKGQ